MSDFLPTIDSDDELPAPQTAAASSKQAQKEAQGNNKKRKREELQQNNSKRKDTAASDDFAGGFTFDNLGGAYTSNSGKGDVWVR